MASRLQDVILRGLAAAKPLAADVAPGTLYFSSDTGALDRSTGAAWESYSGGSGAGAGSIVILTADPASPADDTGWFLRSGTSPAMSVSLKLRVAGVTYELPIGTI